MTNFYTLLTSHGAALLTTAYYSGVPLSLSHLAVGDGNGQPVTPTEAMSALVREVHRVPLSSLNSDSANPNWLVAEAVLPSNVGGWTVREVGLLDANGQLIAIGNFPDTYKPLLAEGSGRDLLIRMIIETGNAESVALTVDPGVVLATSQTVINAVVAHEAKPDPHPQYLTEPDGDGRYIKTAEKGAAAGVAPLVGGLVPFEHLPPAIASDAELAASLAAHVDPENHPHAQYLRQPEGDARYVRQGQRAARFFFNQI